MGVTNVMTRGSIGSLAEFRALALGTAESQRRKAKVMKGKPNASPSM